MVDWQQLLAFLHVGEGSLVKALLVIVFGYFIARTVRKKLTEWLKSHSDDPTAKLFFVNATYAIMLVVLAIIFLGALGVPTASLITLLGASTLAIALALKDSFSNIAGGLMLIMLKPFKLGDVIEVSGASGTVDQINLFNIRLKSGNNEGVYIPNSKLLSDKITNKTYNTTRRIELLIGIGYESDISKAKAAIMDIMSNDERILQEPKPVVAVKELAESAIVLTVRPWVNRNDYASCQFDLNEKIKAMFDSIGISIPYKQLDLHIKRSREERG